MAGKRNKRLTAPAEFFSMLVWLDGRPLLDVVEPYRMRIFERFFCTFDDEGAFLYNLALLLRAKKNWKTFDLVIASLYRLCATDWAGGNIVYTIANDEDQARDDLDLGKKIIATNPELRAMLTVKKNIIERRDHKGFWEILPAGDVAGSHGKTYGFCGFDEIHAYRTWDILEALQLDPHRPDAQMWITTYNSIFHRPGIPLFDLLQRAWAGDDPRMLFSYYAADKTTDPDFENALPEDRANPSRASWNDPRYLEQQQRRLPAHKYRRLHLNLPGLPEGSAFTAEKVMEAVERAVKVRSPQAGIEYVAFVDMSGGSNDDAVLCIAHREGDPESGRAILDRVVDQGQRPPFDPRLAVQRFAAVLKDYGIFSVTGDKYAGETFIQDFERHDIGYQVSELTKSQLYEAMEPRLNSGAVVLLDEPKMESQLLGLVWRGGKIDHAGGEHDDYANASAGAIHVAFEGAGDWKFESLSRPAEHMPDWGDPAYGGGREQTLADYVDGIQDNDGGMSTGRAGDDPFRAW